MLHMKVCGSSQLFSYCQHLCKGAYARNALLHTYIHIKEWIQTSTIALTVLHSRTTMARVVWTRHVFMHAHMWHICTYIYDDDIVNNKCDLYIYIYEYMPHKRSYVINHSLIYTYIYMYMFAIFIHVRCGFKKSAIASYCHLHSWSQSIYMYVFSLI
jgi:hypothetical protein